MGYLFDHAWKEERRRLAAMEARFDPFTIQCLESMGAGPGWRCLEVGAGGGSMAEWLCRRVGSTGLVVATDLETKFVEAIEAPNLEVRRHDIAREPLEERAFDLVHARKVVEHLADPAPALARMYGSLRPGGWLFLEDADMVSLRQVKGIPEERFVHGYQAFLETMRLAGFDPSLGLRLGDLLRELGARDVEVRGILGEWSGEDPMWRLTFEKLRPQVQARGLLTADEIDTFFADLSCPDFRAVTAIHVAAWGRKPE